MLNKNYFYTRLKELVKNSDRDLLGERELKTFMTLITKKRNSLFGINKINPFKNKNIVDLGCGDQYLRKSFEKYGGNYSGIDVNTCDFNHDRLPFERNSQDFVIFLAVIEHLKDPNNILNEIKRILNSKGILILSSPDINAVGNKFWNDPTHVHPYNPFSIKKLLKMYDFNDIKVYPNFRCQIPFFYRESSLMFALSRILPFRGTNKLPIPSILKSRCSGFFAIAYNSKSNS